MFTTIIQSADFSALLDLLAPHTPGALHAPGAPQCRIFDCRARLGDEEWGLKQYLEGHIAGAQHLDLDQDLANPPGIRGRHPLPDRERLANTLAVKGLNACDQVVVYDDVGGAIAARAWWCLRWLGHEGVAVLDGGLPMWKGPLTSGAEIASPGDFACQPALTKQIDAKDLNRALGSFHLIDARSQLRFDGVEEPIDKVAGHIPGAVCCPFQNNLEKNGRFKSAKELALNFPEMNRLCVAYCGSGVTAAHNILAMRIAGLEEPALYPGSWSEWIENADRPREP